mmetsp:Transcript_17789/g.41451  ORF Transcript_17789/g.41451 Transcript_17789/m.41451 type:complete len:852 (+) Transcript_17789:90-2645(+)
MPGRPSQPNLSAGHQVDLDAGFNCNQRLPACFPSDGLSGEYSAVAGDKSKSSAQRQASALLADAEQHYEKGLVQEAIDLSTEAAMQFKAEKDLTAAADAIRLSIQALRLKAEVSFGDPLEARKLAEKELAQFQAKSDKLGEAAMLLSLVELKESEDVLLAGSEAAQVTEMATKARDIFKEAGDKKREGLSLVALADLHLRPGLSDDTVHQALECAEQGLELCTAAGYQAGEARCLHALAVAKSLGEEAAGIRHGHRDGMEAAKEAMQVYRDLERPRSAANELHTLALLALRKKDYPQARNYAKQACDEIQDLSGACGMWQAAMSKTLVLAYGLCNDVDKALAKAKQSMEFFQERSYEAGEASANEMLAQAYFFKAEASKDAPTAEENEGDEEPSEADNPLRQALLAAQDARGIYQSIGARASEAKLALKIAQLYLAMDDHRKGLTYAEEAQSIAQELASPELEGVCLQVQVKAMHDSGDVKAAMGKAIECMNLFQDLQLQPQAGLSMLNCSMLSALQGELDEALEMAAKAQGAFRESRNVRHEIDSLRLLVELHAFNKEPEKAVKFALKALNMTREYKCLEDEVHILLRIVHLYLDQEAKVLEEGLDAARFDTQASKYLKEAAAAASRLQSNTLLGSVAHARGYVNLTAGRFQDALKAATNALEIFRGLGDLQGEGNTWMLVSEVHFHNDKKDKAKDVANKALEVFKRIPGLDGREGEAQVKEILQKVQQSQAYILASPDQVAQLAAGGGQADGVVAAASSGGAGAAEVAPALDSGTVRSMISHIVNEVIGVEDIEDDSPLMEAGMDSLSSLDFRNKLKSTFTGVSLPASTVFDYPSVSAITNLIVEESGK